MATGDGESPSGELAKGDMEACNDWTINMPGSDLRGTPGIYSEEGRSDFGFFPFRVDLSGVY